MRFPVVYLSSHQVGLRSANHATERTMEELRDKLSNLVERIGGIMVRL